MIKNRYLQGAHDKSGPICNRKFEKMCKKISCKHSTFKTKTLSTQKGKKLP